MATGNPFLTDWVKSAYGMEMSLVSMLERQAQDVQGDSQLRMNIDRHLGATRHHVDLLRDRLQRMGENAAAIQPANPLDGVFSGRTYSDGLDVTLRSELVDFVTENFEVASYRALAALARQMGDQDTAQICDAILRDEQAMAGALDQILPDRQQMAATGPQPGPIRIVRETWDALNAHDLDRAFAYLADDVKIYGTGVPGPISKRLYRDFVETQLTAFPDLQFDVQHIVGQGDSVLTDWIFTGTQQASLPAPNGTSIPATGKKVCVAGCNIVDVHDGKVTRLVVLGDTADLLRQLGETPQVQPEQVAGQAVGANRENIQVARESFAALNAHDLNRWMSLIADDFYGEAPGTSHAMDQQQNRAYLQNFLSAFPDLHFEQLRTIAGENRVVVNWEAIGTQTGPLHSPTGRTIAPTNRKAKQFGSTTFEIKNGKISRAWVYFDMSVLMEQLGMTA